MGKDRLDRGRIEIMYRSDMIGQRRKGQEFKLGALVPKSTVLERFEAFFRG